jgi:tRNA threonylcarbamoyladenosine biosynthesis protein TsaE
MPYTAQYALEELEQVANLLIEKYRNIPIWIFEAEMGAGKTTLIRQLVKLLGSTDLATSPTFSLVNEYATPEGSLFHFDFYRLTHEKEAESMGLDEYFESGRLSFIEWPQNVASILRAPLLHIKIVTLHSGKRELTALQVYG